MGCSSTPRTGWRSRSTQATAALRAALVLAPDLWPAEMYLGFALSQLGDEPNAKRALRRGAAAVAVGRDLVRGLAGRRDRDGPAALVVDLRGRVADATGVLPTVRAALICERVLTETDGVVSAIRIFSRIEVPPGATLEATLLLMLANVDPESTPHHRVLMSMETSEGDVLGRQEFAITSPAEADTSFSLVLPFRFQAPVQDRTFWLRFAYDTDEQLLTRVPIQLRRQPAATE